MNANFYNFVNFRTIRVHIFPTKDIQEQTFAMEVPQSLIQVYYRQECIRKYNVV